MTDYTRPTPENRTIVPGFWSDLLDDFKNSFIAETATRINASTLSAFSGAGATGKAFARTIPITLESGEVNSVFFEKNANIAIRFVRAKGFYLEAVAGEISGTILSINELISTNGILTNGFFGSIEYYNGPAVGDVVLGSIDELSDSFYPDGLFVVQIRNETEATISTFLSIGVEQISETGVYIVLEPDTFLTETTEMSDYNGTN